MAGRPTSSSFSLTLGSVDNKAARRLELCLCCTAALAATSRPALAAVAAAPSEFPCVNII